MISFSIIYQLILLHFVASFLFQLPNVITYRGYTPRKLVTHSICYAIPFAWFGAQFLIAVCSTHYVITVVTNDALRKLWENKRAKLHMMLFSFVQLLDVASLVFVYWLIGVNTIIPETISKVLPYVFKY